MAQPRPYIGYVYPAGGQQGGAFHIRLGGQNLDEITGIIVTGTGVTASITEFDRRLNPQITQLLNEQIAALKRQTNANTNSSMMSDQPMSMMSESMTDSETNTTAPSRPKSAEACRLIELLERRIREYVHTPACDSIATIVQAEVVIMTNAEPGRREIRIVTRRGVSNPLPFYVGQWPEYAKEPMKTSPKQILGKESQALRQRLPGDDEDWIKPPCTVNGQISSSEVNRYRFGASKGQRLVITTLGRQLVPFIADAVPGWFQPVLTVYDALGREVAYNDDYRFNPDPTLCFEVPEDGEYQFTIRDSLYRGREDFVYRITVGELPFITSIFPLGGPMPIHPKMEGWNLKDAKLVVPTNATTPGTVTLTAEKNGLFSNPMSYALGTLPEKMENESNDTVSRAQKATLPVIINGRIDRTNDIDIFQFHGKSNEMIAVEVTARRLGSPLDSVIQLTDSQGRLLAFNDDCQDPGTGINTHFADSYFMVRLPSDGTYYVHITDTARRGGPEYGYRLRISQPQPDFELRAVPSSLAIRSNASAALTVYAQRKDGFAGPIKLSLKDPPPGFTNFAATIASTQAVARITIKTKLSETENPVRLTIQGTAKIGTNQINHDAIPCEDRMQAFLWRQLVPAEDLPVMVINPDAIHAAKRIPPPRPPVSTNTTAATNASARTNTLSNTNAVPTQPKFTQKQVAGRLRQLKILYEDGLLTDEFYNEKVAECDTVEP